MYLKFTSNKSKSPIRQRTVEVEDFSVRSCDNGSQVVTWIVNGDVKTDVVGENSWQMCFVTGKNGNTIDKISPVKIDS